MTCVDRKGRPRRVARAMAHVWGSNDWPRVSTEFAPGVWLFVRDRNVPALLLGDLLVFLGGQEWADWVRSRPA